MSNSILTEKRIKFWERLTGITVILIIVGYIGFYFVQKSQVAPVFKIQVGNEPKELIGLAGNFGLEKRAWNDKNFLMRNQSEFYTWYFLNIKSDLTENHLKILATHNKTDEKLEIFSSPIQLNKVGNNVLTGTVYTTFPEKGIWSLDVFLNYKKLGTVEVRVRDRFINQIRESDKPLNIWPRLKP